jgi:uncharacterized protein YbjT (DUF2867 family)
MKIVVTGSLGNIGKPLTKELVEKGHTVVVISSNSDKQKGIESLGASAAIGSVENADFLTSALADADAVFTMVPPNYAVPDSRAYYNTIGNSFAEAIKKSTIKHVVNLSSWGAHLAEGTGFITGAYDVEKILDSLPNVAITHLRAGFIYYNLFHFTDMIKNVGFIGSNYGGEDKIVMVSPIDIAAVAAEELEKTNASSKVRYVASDDLTASKAALVLGNAIGISDLKWLNFTDEQTKETMEKHGLPANTITNMIQLNASIHNGAMREDYDLHQPELGKVKIEDFAKEFALTYLNQ